MKRCAIIISALCIGALALLPMAAEAAAAPTPEPADTCTDGPQFDMKPPPNTPGLVTTIAKNVQDVLNTAASTMFNAITGAPEFVYGIQGVLTLYVAIYGILFTFGMTQVTVYDFLQRMIKIAIVALLIYPNTWLFFSQYVVNFFNSMVNEVTNFVISVAVGGLAPSFTDCSTNVSTELAICSAPLAALDQAITSAISANMAVHLLATAFTSAYGLMYAALMGIALWSFIGSVLTGIWVYLMSMVLRALLFGIAPIFIACLLFERTRHLFDGWLNQVVNACLQPILLFTFFSFFLILVQTSIDNILSVPVCWSEANESARGTPWNFHFWRYTVPNPNTATDFEPYGGPWRWDGADVPGAPIFPIDIMAVLVFFILAELGKRFNQVVLMIARDLAGASTDLSRMQGSLNELFSSGKEQGGGGNAAPAGDQAAPKNYGKKMGEIITSRNKK